MSTAVALVPAFSSAALAAGNARSARPDDPDTVDENLSSFRGNQGTAEPSGAKGEALADQKTTSKRLLC
jgi:hypothetical protein